MGKGKERPIRRRKKREKEDIEEKKLKNKNIHHIKLGCHELVH